MLNLLTIKMLQTFCCLFLYVPSKLNISTLFLAFDIIRPFPLISSKISRVQWGKTCVYLAGQTPQTTQVALHFHCCLCGWLSCFHNNTGVLEVRSTGCNDFLWRLSNIWIDNHHNRSFRRASRWAMAGQPSRITLEYGHFRSRGVRYKGTWL